MVTTDNTFLFNSNKQFYNPVFKNRSTSIVETNRHFTADIKNHIIKYPTPANIYFVWGFGSLIGVLLFVQVITGVLLAMQYVADIQGAFASVERIMREVPMGWLLRYLHANGSSFLFILLYSHIGRVLYYQLYKKPKQWVWCSGVLLFILMAGIAFLGYTLPWGQISFWGATVITNLLTAVPVIGHKLVVWVWGGFAINQNTLNRFFSLHYILPLVVLALSAIHLLLVHTVGSTNPTVNDSELDGVRFTPYFLVKYLVTFIVFLFTFLFITFYQPNLFGHSDNYLEADPLVTPAHIVPEWYFLPFYAMLKAFPSKALGALAMLLSMVVLFALPWLDSLVLGTSGVINSPYFKVGYSSMFIFFCANFAFLGALGGTIVTDITQLWMQIGTGVYFSFYLVVLPFFSWKEWNIFTRLVKAEPRALEAEPASTRSGHSFHVVKRQGPFPARQLKAFTFMLKRFRTFFTKNVIHGVVGDVSYFFGPRDFWSTYRYFFKQTERRIIRDFFQAVFFSPLKLLKVVKAKRVSLRKILSAPHVGIFREHLEEIKCCYHGLRAGDTLFSFSGGYMHKFYQIGRFNDHERFYGAIIGKNKEKIRDRCLSVRIRLRLPGIETTRTLMYNKIHIFPKYSFLYLHDWSELVWIERRRLVGMKLKTVPRYSFAARFPRYLYRRKMQYRVFDSQRSDLRTTINIWRYKHNERILVQRRW